MFDFLFKCPLFCAVQLACNTSEEVDKLICAFKDAMEEVSPVLSLHFSLLLLFCQDSWELVIQLLEFSCLHLWIILFPSSRLSPLVSELAAGAESLILTKSKWIWL